MEDRYFEKYQYGIGPSKEHQEAMDHIYDRQEEGTEEDHFVKCRNEKCDRWIEPLEEPVFVVTVDGDRVFWCKQCVEGA